MAEYFNLSEEEKKMRLPSGKQVVYKFRIGWARTYLYYAGLIERVDKGVYKITERGLEVLREKPSKINVNYLMRFPESENFSIKVKKRQLRMIKVHREYQKQKRLLRLLIEHISL